MIVKLDLDRRILSCSSSFFSIDRIFMTTWSICLRSLADVFVEQLLSKTVGLEVRTGNFMSVAQTLNAIGKVVLKKKKSHNSIQQLSLTYRGDNSVLPTLFVILKYCIWNARGWKCASTKAVVIKKEQELR